jgi:hypothetical protein
LNLAGILNLDDPVPSGQPSKPDKKPGPKDKGSPKDPFSLDDFDISKFKI